MLNSFLQRIKQGQTISFAETIDLINALYQYQPSEFSNGLSNPIINQAGQNEGSCKIFAFASLHQLDQTETLRLFGEHYQAVLDHPNSNDHANIRTFMRDGWAGIHYQGQALTER